MTHDPERLIDSKAGSGPLERELLTSLRAFSPPKGAHQQAWDGVSRRIALLGVVGAAVAAPKAASAASALLPSSLVAKVLVGVSLGALGLGTAFVVAPATSPQAPLAQPATSGHEPASANAVVDKPAESATTTCEGEGCDTQVDAPAEPNVVPHQAGEKLGSAARRAPLDAAREDSLARESTLLVQARAALRAGDTAGARAALLQLEARFPRGMLGQEREVLNIELLAARGDAKSAERRAAAFIAAHPNSPHAAKLARFVSGR